MLTVIIVMVTIAALSNVFFFFIVKNTEDEKFKRIISAFVVAFIAIDLSVGVLLGVVIAGTEIKTVVVAYYDAEDSIITLVDDEGKAYERVDLEDIAHTGSYYVGGSAYLIVDAMNRTLVLFSSDTPVYIPKAEKEPEETT